MNRPENVNHGDSSRIGETTEQRPAIAPAVRAWARSAGMRVARTGRLRRAVLDAWHAAGSPMPEPAAVPAPPSGWTRAEVAAAARAWAHASGLEVADTGRLPSAVLQAWHAAGSPMPAAVLCSQPGCHRVAAQRAAMLCRPCYSRLRRGQQLHADQSRSGPAHVAWVGAEVGYDGAHSRVVSRYGAASLYVCNACDSRARDWALMPDAADVRQDAGRPPHSPNPDDYRPMCHPCHNAMDWQHRQALAVLEDPGDVLDGLDVGALVVLPSPTRQPLRRYLAPDQPGSVTA